MSTAHTEILSMHIDGAVYKSHLSYPAGQQEPQPGILIIPEFWGLTEYITQRAVQLAELGYCALALDIYGESWTAVSAEEASTAMNKLFSNIDKTAEIIKKHLSALKDLKQTKDTQTAVMGYCMGGALALHIARLGENIQGAISFHGDLTAHTSAKSIKAKILVCHAEKDEFVPPSQVESFKKEMNKAQADYKFISYPSAKHGFTNPQAHENSKKFNIPIDYNESADKKSWKELTQFLKDIF